MTIFTPDGRNEGPEGSIALRSFFNELFLEREAAISQGSDGDSDSCGSESVSFSRVATGDESSDCDSASCTISLSSDEETVTTADLVKHGNEETKDATLHRGSFHSRQRQPKFSISPDNAAGIRSGSKTELMISSYYSLSASAHSLGSRTGISSTTVGNWRSSLHKHRASLASRQVDRNNHKDSRWSTCPLNAPNNSQSNLVKQYDFGFVNDSMHVRKIRRSKSGMTKRFNKNKTFRGKTEQGGLSLADSSTRTIDSEVRLANEASSDEDSSDGEEFYEDDEASLSSFTDSFVSSRGNTTIGSTCTLGSSLDFGSRYKIRTKNPESSARVLPSRTKSGGDLPRLPHRTWDDPSFNLSDPSFNFSETFEPLKGDSSSHRGGFQKTKMRRSLSDDISITAALGRWTATITNKDPDSPNNNSGMFPALPRRSPSLSGSSERLSKKTEGKLRKISSRSTGRYSNHSNDSSEFSDSDSESSSNFHNSFACDSESSLSATMATTALSTKVSSNCYMLSSSSAHSPRLSIPESLMKLPHHSFHGSSTTSTKTINRGLQNPGKSLLTTSRA